MWKPLHVSERHCMGCALGQQNRNCCVTLVIHMLQWKCAVKLQIFCSPCVEACLYQKKCCPAMWFCPVSDSTLNLIVKKNKRCYTSERQNGLKSFWTFQWAQMEGLLGVTWGKTMCKHKHGISCVSFHVVVLKTTPGIAQVCFFLLTGLFLKLWPCWLCGHCWTCLCKLQSSTGVWKNGPSSGEQKMVPWPEPAWCCTIPPKMLIR